MRSLVVDTYAWIAYFDKNNAFRNLIEENDLETPAIVFAELSRVFNRRRLSAAEIREALSVVESRSVIVTMDKERAEKGGEVAVKEGLALADGIVYSHSSEEKEVLTGDEHFRGKKNVMFVK